MFGLGFTEILVILTVALLVFGPKRLPEMARTLGKTMGELRRTLDDVKFEISQAETEERTRDLEERRKKLASKDASQPSEPSESSEPSEPESE